MSDHDHDAPSRPRYGELASPEEQRAAIKQPAPWQLEAEQQTDAPPQPAAGTQYPQAPHHPQSPQYPPPPAQYRTAASPRRAGLGNRILTFVLLGIGLYSVVGMIGYAVTGGEAVRQSAETLSPGEADLVAGLPDWIWVAGAVAYSVIWLIALFASLAALRAGRVSFWIPLVAGVLAMIVFLAFMIIAVGQNPSLVPTIPSGGTGTGTDT